MDLAESGDPRLRRTYEYLGTVNRVARWKAIYRQFLLPRALESSDRSIRVLDIGCGAGDTLKEVVSLFEQDGFQVSGVGVDLEPTAIELATRRHPLLHFLCRDAATLEPSSFDFVLSNHVIHHLSESHLSHFLQSAERLAKKLVLFNDIERSAVGYYAFKLSTQLFFPDSFIRPDGLTSIRRSYRKDELERVIPPGWWVERYFPYRLLLMFRPK